MTAEHRATPAKIAEQDHTQRPIDRLRQPLTEAQTEHLEFLTPDGKKVLLCTDRYFEGRRSALPLPKEHEVVVVFGDPDNRMCYPDHEFEEQFWFKRGSVDIVSEHARIVVDSPFLGNIERPEEDEFSLWKRPEEDEFSLWSGTGTWQGEEYDRLVNRVLEIIQQSTPLTPVQ